MRRKPPGFTNVCTRRRTRELKCGLSTRPSGSEEGTATHLDRRGERDWLGMDRPREGRPKVDVGQSSSMVWSPHTRWYSS